MTEVKQILINLVNQLYSMAPSGVINTAITNAEKQIKQQERERVEKAGGISIFIKSVRGMMHALALDRPDIELIEDYGMLGIHNIRAVNESLSALKELEEQ